ncbi:hypothetical protein E2C01_067180 [Portunus trituberculatus]|uniref:Uncharacterized protein n=1 Tax=Portunus trituberculatus TaxID=210409 RepID=A0A5B7HSY1_PORTR|nr:hypothetical protein [Portunus trituberculatus]
MHGGLGTSLVL